MNANSLATCICQKKKKNPFLKHSQCQVCLVECFWKRITWEVNHLKFYFCFYIKILQTERIIARFCRSPQLQY